MAISNIQAEQAAAAAASAPAVAISFRLLLALYSVIPLSLLIQFLDANYADAYLQQSLTSSPKHFILLLIIIGTPHIIASSMILFGNREYLQLYKFRIIGMTLAIIVVFGFGSLFLPYHLLFVLVAVWTIYHVLKQQHGIARGVCRLSGWQFNLQLWLSIAAGIFIYMGIFLKNSLLPEQLQLIGQISALFCAALVMSTLYCQRSVPTAFGKVFLWANAMLVLSSFYLYLQQYHILAILVPRLVHDSTAFIFYVSHDYNRHHRQPQNLIYRVARKLHLNSFIVLPLLSFALAVVLQQYGDHVVNWLGEVLFGVEIKRAITLGLLGYLALMHYYSEAFTWKGDSPYRQFIIFKK